MTPELQHYYEETIAIFNTPGWKYLAEDLRNLLADVADVRNCTNLDEAKGRIAELEYFLNSPERFTAAYDALKEQDQ